MSRYALYLYLLAPALPWHAFGHISGTSRVPGVQQQWRKLNALAWELSAVGWWAYLKAKVTQ